MKDPFTGKALSPADKRLFQRALRFWLVFLACSAVTGYLTLWITSLRQPVIVPSVIGLDQKDAERVLRSKSLRARVSGSQWDDRLGEGAVLIQKPSANTYLKRGSVMELVISKGNPQVKVPDLTGQSVRRAQVLLTQTRLRVGRRSTLSTALFPQDQVLAQSPEAGRAVETSSAINVLIASGPSEPTYFMPQLRNQPLVKALQLFRPVGVIIDKIKTEVHDDVESGLILDQDPGPGARLKPLSNVSLTVSAKSSDLAKKARWTTLHYQLPVGPPKRVRIDVLDGSGTRTVYNAMEEGGSTVQTGLSVAGKASAQVYLNNAFDKEIEIE